MSEAPVNDMTFEAALAELEQVVGRLESGEVPLAESIALYQRGNALAKRCDDALRSAEMQVEQITADKNGDATGTAPLDG